MTVTIAFPALFSDRIGGLEAVEVDGTTVGAALRALTARHAPLDSLVWRPGPGGPDRTLNPVMAVFLNGRQLGPDELTTPVSDGDEIAVLSALEGG